MRKEAPLFGAHRWLSLAGALLVLSGAEPSRAQWVPDGRLVCAAPLRQIGAGVVADGAGGAFITWLDNRGGIRDQFEIYVQHLTETGTIAVGWPEDGRLVCRCRTSAGPYLLSDGAGGVLLIWMGIEPPGFYGLRLDATGVVAPGWQAGGTLIVPAAGYSYLLRAVPDGLGGALLAWEFFDGALGVDTHVMRIASDGIPPTGWTSPGVQVLRGTGEERFADMVADGSGGVIVVTTRYAADRVTSHLFLYHVTAAGILDSGWTPGGFPLCTAPGGQWEPVTASDGAGGVYVAWTDFRSRRNADIFAQHITASGRAAAGWAGNGIVVCDAYRRQYQPRIVADGSGGALVVWQDLRSGDRDEIYAQRLDSRGRTVAGWPANGVALSRSSNGKVRLLARSDGMEGAIVGWHQYKGADQYSGTDFFAQRVGADGVIAAGWPQDGVPMCTAPGYRANLGLDADGTGGVIAAWEDGRQGPLYADVDIYAQRVSADGQRLVPIGIEALSATAGENGVTVRWMLAAEARESLRAVDVHRAVHVDGPYVARNPMPLQPAASMLFLDETAPLESAWYRIVLTLKSGREVISAPVEALQANWTRRTMLGIPVHQTASGSIELHYSVGPERAPLQLAIYDPRGRRIRLLVHEWQDPGTYVRLWDRCDAVGAPAARGVYIVGLSAGSTQVTRKLVLLRE